MSDPANWPTLTLTERRILGVLVEKQKTTPDVYPMSLNALVNGCNQKSNRDPILNLSDVDVEDALPALQKQGVVMRVDSGRVEKWRHTLYDTWHVNKFEVAVLAELLLRGAQTEGELRGRVSRMEPVDDLDALRAILKPLAERRLVVYLSPEGRRGTTVTHGFHDAGEVDRLKARHFEASDAEPEPVRRPTTPAANPEELAALRTEVGELRRHVADLGSALAALDSQVKALQTALGVTPG